MTQPAKHTPGPWIVDGVYTIRGPKRCVVAKLIDSKEPYETKVANGHMLAAAPAMYEALKQTFNVMENILTDSQLDTRTPCGLTIREWESKVRIALAQAEGKQ